MSVLVLTNVSQDLASLELAGSTELAEVGRRVYIERRQGGWLRVYTLAGWLRTVGLVGTPIQAVKLAVKELEDSSHDCNHS